MKNNREEKSSGTHIVIIFNIAIYPSLPIKYN